MLIHRIGLTLAIAFLVTSATPAVAQPAVKPPIRGLVSMGAFKFMGYGGDPVNALEPLNAKPGIFGGKRCVFDNHDLDADTPKSILPLHAAMQRMGPEIQFQTLHATPPNWEGTIKRGVSLGASSIQLWQDYGGFPQVPDATLKRWAAMLEASKVR